MSEGQKNARQKLGDKYLLPFQLKSKLDFNTVFKNNNPTYLEIGFGMGDTAVEVAQSYPEHNYIGVEVHPPGVGRALKLSEDSGL